jgi:tRNA pseudouridine38-40 synthase
MVAYLGQQFCGWQRQHPLRALKSIQETIEAALFSVTGEQVCVTSSGRTDAGVNARAQIVHFDLPEERFGFFVKNPQKLLSGVNFWLGDSIQFLGLSPLEERLAKDFHSRKEAVAKRYIYHFQKGPCHLPQNRGRTLWVKALSLDVALMHQAALVLLGTRDFASFCAADSSAQTTIRTIFDASVRVVPSLHTSDLGALAIQDIEFCVTGSGFLKQMVRRLAGSVLQIGLHREPLDALQQALENPHLGSKGPTLGSSGLWLDRVYYPHNFGVAWLPVWHNNKIPARNNRLF